MQILIDVIEGGQHAIALPDFGTPNSDEMIELGAKALCDESRRRKAARRNSRSSTEAWESWLRPVSYRFICHMIEEGLESDILRRIKKYKRHTSSENIFSRYLLGIFAEDQANFTESDRHRISRQLWYAYRHYVPWHFLNGFLLQMKDFDLQSDLLKIEPGFEDWIIERRAFPSQDRRIRGAYPKHIEDGCRARMQQFAEMLDRR